MKTILITGAGSGMGRDAAIALAKRGHKVIATTHTDEQAKSLTEYFSKLNCEAAIFKLDITNEIDRKKIRAIPLDVLINNAGTGETGPLSEVPLDRVRHVFEVNVFGTLALTHIALAGMIERKKGTVEIVSSVAGRIPIPFLAPYAMTKFALSAGGAAMRDEVHRIAPNVHVTLIEPGAYATGFNQRMCAKKFEWLDEQSAYARISSKFKQEDKRFARVEVKTTDSIVAKMVKAAEASRPKLRYVAPWYMGPAIWFARVAGR